MRLGFDVGRCRKLAGVPEGKFEAALEWADRMGHRLVDGDHYERFVDELLFGPRYAIARQAARLDSKDGAA